MGLAADLLDLCNDTATWNILSSRDGYGVPTFALKHANYPARLIRKNKLLRLKDEQEVTSTAQLWVLPSLTSGDPFPAISTHDQVVLSDGTMPQIADAQIFEDELLGQTGEPAYTVVYFV